MYVLRKELIRPFFSARKKYYFVDLPEGETAREEEEGIRKWNEATGYEKG